MLLVGTSGWSYRHWRGRFYPPELPPWQWFSFYLREFATVELNVTFYRLPARKRFEEWARLAAERPGFVFAVKAPRTITHLRRLVDAAEEFRRFQEAIAGLGSALGPLLFQLPPGFTCDLDRLRAFLELLPAGQSFAFEFRHPSWFVPSVAEVIASAGGTVVYAYGGVHPTPEDFPQVGPLCYVRVHSGLYDIGLTDEEIDMLAGRLQRYADYPGYVYFNNDAFAHAVMDARRLRAALAQRGVTVE
jgi:uncharacterized protein YecE (DUF72 family)|uniref:DUF72 domain-containing protein n=1 Tax=Thermomicrobium roseum TaxID=500 RepID=A0A7C2B6A7_THERO